MWDNITTTLNGWEASFMMITSPEDRQTPQPKRKRGVMPYVAMPTDAPTSETHRARFVPPIAPACVARPVGKKELEGSPAALKARDAEWSRLRDKHVWDDTCVKSWKDVASDARKAGKEVHLGRLFGFCVEKGSELADGDPGKKMKYRVVSQGNNVVNQNWQIAMFQDLGSCPASMEAAKWADCYGCFRGHWIEQADCEQAYCQAELAGTETWVCLPEDQ